MAELDEVEVLRWAGVHTPQGCLCFTDPSLSPVGLEGFRSFLRGFPAFTCTSVLKLQVHTVQH